MFSTVLVFGFLLAAQGPTACPCEPVCTCVDCRCDQAAKEQSARASEATTPPEKDLRSCKAVCPCRPCVCAGGNCPVQAAPTAKCQCKPECKCNPCRCGEKCPVTGVAGEVAGPTAKCQCKPECKCNPCRCGEKPAQTVSATLAGGCPCGDQCACDDCRCCAGDSPCAECRCGSCAAGGCPHEAERVAVGS